MATCSNQDETEPDRTCLSRQRAHQVLQQIVQRANHCRLVPLFLSNTANIGPSDTMLP
jgi:hypothetical protein